MKFLLVEQTVDEFRASFLRARREEEVIVIPYPAYIHYKHAEIPSHIIPGQNRTITAVMIGSLKRSSLRTILGVMTLLKI